MSGRTLWFRAVIAIAMGIGIASAGTASATLQLPTLHGTATSYAGCPLDVSIDVDDQSVPGDLVITLQITGPGTTTGNLRGFFVQVADESLLSGLSVTGPNVESSTILANGVPQASGHSATPQSSLTPGPYDLGIVLGSDGYSRRDLRTVTFTLSHATASLDASFLSGQTFGVNATSSQQDRCGSCSSSLVGVVPEPGTGLLMGLGLAGLAVSRPRSRAH